MPIAVRCCCGYVFLSAEGPLMPERPCAWVVMLQTRRVGVGGGGGGQLFRGHGRTVEPPNVDTF